MRILFDVRETDSLRGCHVLAAAALMAASLRHCRCCVLTDGRPDEEIALNILRFDTGLHLPPWRGRRWGRARGLDLFLSIADAWQEDAETREARACAHLSVVGLTFPGTAPAREAGLIIVDGNDTPAVAAAALRALGLAPGGVA